MNNPSRSALNYLGLLFVATLIGACGVKGKPLPPLQPAMIGTGAPEQKASKVKSKNPDKEAEKDFEEKK